MANAFLGVRLRNCIPELQNSSIKIDIFFFNCTTCITFEITACIYFTVRDQWLPVTMNFWNLVIFLCLKPIYLWASQKHLDILVSLYTVQADLRDIADLVPDHCSKVSHNKASCNPFAGGGSCLRFVKNTISVKSNKVKHNTMRFASSWAEKLLFLVCFKKLYLKP